jgi:D-3-phosphoglycerate dehydrogenase
MYKILTLNNISDKGLERLPKDQYQVAGDTKNPDAILVRSFKMHDMQVPETVQAIGRAGAGVNNIPVDKMSKAGVVVFNAPGANANAVKELVIAGMLLAYRHICQAWQYTIGLQGDDASLNKQVEEGKKKYAGFELPGRTLGVVGLGAIGVLVANAARDLGMRVIGYDPSITVQNAWRLSSDIEHAVALDDLFAKADFVTFHVPLIDATRNLLNAQRLAKMKKGVVVLNFAREGIIDDDAVCAAIDSGKVYAYVTDFPTNKLIKHPKVITLPHLGASTEEAEENCAIMVADQVRDYLENGNVRNSVNFPSVNLPRAGQQRLAVVNENRPDMVGQISRALGENSINIVHMVNESKGDMAYTLVDVESNLDNNLVAKIKAIKGVLAVRVI